MPDVPFSAIYPYGPGAPGPLINPLYPGMPVGATPITRDIELTAVGTFVIWDPGANRTFILASAFISSDTAGRIKLIDNDDLQGQRPVGQWIGANGGSSPNLVPVPYPAKKPGNQLKVVSTVAGNVAIRVSGWEVSG